MHCWSHAIAMQLWRQVIGEHQDFLDCSQRDSWQKCMVGGGQLKVDSTVMGPECKGFALVLGCRQDWILTLMQGTECTG